MRNHTIKKSIEIKMIVEIDQCLEKEIKRSKIRNLVQEIEKKKKEVEKDMIQVHLLIIEEEEKNDYY